MSEYRIRIKRSEGRDLWFRYHWRVFGPLSSDLSAQPFLGYNLASGFAITEARAERKARAFVARERTEREWRIANPPREFIA